MATRIPTPPEVPTVQAETPRERESEPAVTAKGTHSELAPPTVTAKGTHSGVTPPGAPKVITAKARVTPPPTKVPTPPATRTIDSGQFPVVRDANEVSERVTLIAHDLKTPLSIIMLETHMLAERIPDQSPAIRHGLERITQNAAYIDRLVADLLDLASAEAGQLQMRFEAVDLGAMLREIVDRAVSSVDRDRVTLLLRHNAYARADRNRIERVVANFIGNALKYSSEPVTVRLEVRDRRARVTVVDRGRGLTDEQVRTLFDRYRRATKSRDGYGLGLYISRKIIDAHGGRLGVVSSPGQGSEFFFELDTIAYHLR